MGEGVTVMCGAFSPSPRLPFTPSHCSLTSRRCCTEGPQTHADAVPAEVEQAAAAEVGREPELVAEPAFRAEGEGARDALNLAERARIDH